MNDTTDAEDRCLVCGWLYAPSRTVGCVPGDCSYRTTDAAESVRLAKRRAEVATLSTLRAEVERLRAENEALRGEVRTEQDARDYAASVYQAASTTFQAAIASLRSDVERLTRATDDWHREATELRAEANQSLAEIARLRDENSRLTRERDEASLALEGAHDEVLVVRTQNEGRRLTIESLTVAYGKLAEERDALSATLALHRRDKALTLDVVRAARAHRETLRGYDVPDGPVTPTESALCSAIDALDAAGEPA